MTTAWTLNAGEVVADALEHLGVLGSGETVSASDLALGLKALDGILKEMPIHGFVWKKVTSTPTLLVWSSGTPKNVSMPSDFYGVPQISFTQNSANVDIELITKAEYDTIIDPDYVALYPLKMYLDSANVGWLWPVPSADPSMYITYQAITSDAVSGSTPDVKQSWVSMFGYWVAYELRLKFQTNQSIINEIKESLAIKRRLCLASSAETAPITFTVND